MDKQGGNSWEAHVWVLARFWAHITQDFHNFTGWTKEQRLTKAKAPGCLKAGSYIIGGFLMFLTVVMTTASVLLLSAILVFKEWGLPELQSNTFPHFKVCHIDTDKGPAFWTDGVDNCISSDKIIQQIMDADLNIPIISLSIALAFGLLNVGFLSVLLHGVTTGKAKLLKIFYFYYAVVISLGTIGTTSLMVSGFPVFMEFNWSIHWICLLLHFLCLLVINRHRTAILAQGGFVKL